MKYIVLESGDRLPIYTLQITMEELKRLKNGAQSIKKPFKKTWVNASYRAHTGCLIKLINHRRREFFIVIPESITRTRKKIGSLNVLGVKLSIQAIIEHVKYTTHHA